MNCASSPALIVHRYITRIICREPQLRLVEPIRQRAFEPVSRDASLSPMYLHDTIVAPATPAGTGAVAIVRLSGPRAFEILDAIWRPAHAHVRQPRKLYLGDVIDSATGALIDRALAVTMPQSASLTGEDVAELQCHGGPFIVRRIVALATASGARLAEPGEF